MKITADEIKAVIKEAGVVADVSVLDENTNFSDAGIDSLDTFNILLSVEEKFVVKIPEEDTDQLNTISAIISYLENS